MTDDRPPICPPGKHDLVCHCGADFDDAYHGNHGPVLMGCAVCYRTPDELTAVRRRYAVACLGGAA